ncbi:MAG: choice-of-anchor tandem repeat GloVer-containing protein [Verrucomicrobiota bacterium]|jgi:uncharacterized repeat protein (TIGR03803 family)
MKTNIAFSSRAGRWFGPGNMMNSKSLFRRLAGTLPGVLLWLAVLPYGALVLPVFDAQAGVVFTTLYSFGSVQDTNGVALDGANPQAGLLQGSDGNFYGTTFWGGTNIGLTPYGWNSWGTVFKMSTNGTLTTLYSFTGDNDGANPSAGLVQGSDGNLYGTTYYGGTNGYGTVFKISTNGVFTSLYSFGSVLDSNGLLLDGSGPNGLVQGSDGLFYGTTQWGGAFTDQYNSIGYGTVFRITTNGALATLYSFGSVQDTNGNPLDGVAPFASLVQGSDGYLYGTTSGGGTDDYGTVFRISTNGVLTCLYSFTGGNDGGGPAACLVQGSDGDFYGTTAGILSRGNIGSKPGSPGSVFKITANGALTALHTFGTFFGENDGLNPQAGLVQGSDGTFYGTTESTTVESGMDYIAFVGPGTVFRISTNGGLTTVHAFGSITNTSGELLDGVSPAAALVQGRDGNFYGTTSSGGAFTNQFANQFGQGYGTVFRLTIVPSPQLTIIPYGENVILTWPTNAFVFTLQSSTGLGSAANWNTNSPSPVVIGGQNVIINPLTGTQMFFRLLLAQ